MVYLNQMEQEHITNNRKGNDMMTNRDVIVDAGLSDSKAADWTASLYLLSRIDTDAVETNWNDVITRRTQFQGGEIKVTMAGKDAVIYLDGTRIGTARRQD